MQISCRVVVCMEQWWVIFVALWNGCRWVYIFGPFEETCKWIEQNLRLDSRSIRRNQLATMEMVFYRYYRSSLPSVCTLHVRPKLMKYVICKIFTLCKLYKVSSILCAAISPYFLNVSVQMKYSSKWEDGKSFLCTTYWPWSGKIYRLVKCALYAGQESYAGHRFIPMQ